MMALSVRNLGSWSAYVPKEVPKDAPAGALFCRRDSDGVDWYKFIESSLQSTTTVKMTVLDDIVQAVSRDASSLFPQMCVLLEVTGITEANPQAVYGGMIYNSSSREFHKPLPFMMPISNRQFFQELAMRNIITRPEALDVVRDDTLPAQLQSVVDGLGADDKFKAEMWLAAGQYQRSHWLIEAFGKALGLPPQELDDVWRHAMIL